jgi:hypothetical protein
MRSLAILFRGLKAMTQTESALKAIIRQGNYASPDYVQAVAKLRELQDRQPVVIEPRKNRGWKV